MIRKIAILGAMALVLPGCFYAHTSQAPIATTYPISEQQKMQAAHHWRVLAANEANGIFQKLNGQSVYVNAGTEEAIFNETFKQLLTSELVSKGAAVMVSPKATVEVSYDVNLIEHKDRGMIRPPEGALTALAAGIAVASIPINHWKEPALGLIPMAAAGDFLIGNLSPETSHEVAITTQVTKDDMLQHSSTNIYYINAGDKEHYVGSAESMRTIRVTDH